MPEPLDFKRPQAMTAESLKQAVKICRAIFVGPVPESVIWAVAIGIMEGNKHARTT